MTKKVFHSKIMIFLIAVILILLPFSINKPDETQLYSIVLGVGIDKAGDQYEISTQIVTSKANQGFLETLQVHSATADNVLGAVEKLGLHLGKIAGFGNASVIVFSEEVAKEGIAETLDFFLRSQRLNSNPIIIITQSKAKDILNDVAKIDESFNYTLNSLAKLNGDFASGTIITLNDFLNNYYSKTKASVVAQINETTEESEGIEIPQNSSNGSGGSVGSVQTSATTGGEGSNQTIYISNTGESSLFVGSKQIATIGPKVVEGMNTLLTSKRNAFTVKNVTDEIYTNASVALSIKDCKIERKLKFSSQGIPRAYYKVKYNLIVEQIQDGRDEILLDGSKDYLTPTLKQKLKDQIMQTASEALQIFKGYNADVYGIQDAFLKYHPKKWQRYLNNLANKDDAFQNVEFFLDIQIDADV